VVENESSSLHLFPLPSALRELLLNIDRPRWVFTASVAHHARRCLEALGIADLFLGYHYKPTGLLQARWITSSPL
jgi:hypothetical protein